MAKGQTRSNREVKKPKLKKVAAAPSSTVKSTLAPIAIPPKRKG